MSGRCCNPSTPKVLRIGDRPALASSMDVQGAASVATRLFDHISCSHPEGLGTATASSSSARLLEVPPLASREFRTILNDLRDRQEELFRQVLDEQKELRNHVLDMHSNFNEKSAYAHDAWKRHHEDFMSAFRDWHCKSHGVPWEQSFKSSGAERAEPAAEVTEQDSNLAPVEPTASNAEKEVGKEFMEQAHQGSLSMKTMGDHQHGADGSRGRCAIGHFLRTKEFEIAIAVAIMTNAFIMCWEVQYEGLDVGYNLQYPGRPTQAEVVWAGAETVFKCFDWFFGSVFCVEALLKLVTWRQGYFYIKPEFEKRKYFHVRMSTATRPEDWSPMIAFLRGVQGWNLLDFFCVAAFILGKIAGGSLNPQTIRLLRLFRLGRLVRLLRFLESLDHLYVMTTAISGLQQVLSWAVILLTMMLLTCDLFLVQILHDTYFTEVKAVDLSEDQLKKYHQVYEYFGTCTRCMLSMFEITLGNWPPVARLLAEEVSEWFTLICLAHKLTIGFAVIGVITGVILQETFKVAQTDDIIMFRQKKLASCILRKKMKALFDALDDSCDGKLEAEEFKTIGDVPEIKVWLGSLGIETDDLATLFSLIDVDDNGYITLEELVHRMPRIQGTSRSIDVLALQRRMWLQSKQLEGAEQGPATGQASFADFLMEPLHNGKMRTSTTSVRSGKAPHPPHVIPGTHVNGT